MTREQIAEIRARADARTSGPWFIRRMGGFSWEVSNSDETIMQISGACVADAVGVIQSRDDVLELCDALEEALDEIERLKLGEGRE